MSVIPLARFLVEFSSEPEAGDGPGAAARQHVLAASAAAVEAAADQIAAAVERGRAEGRTTAEQEFQARLAAQQEEFEKRLSVERQTWAEAESAALVERMMVAMGELEARIAESTARILQPFLTAQLRSQAVAELAALIQTAVSHSPTAALAVSGPGDLIEALRARIGDTVAHVTFSISDAPDVRATLDNTILQTRLEAWITRIEEALA